MSEEFPSVQFMLGVPSEITHAGKTYRLGPANQRSKGILEELVAKHAVESILPMKTYLPADQYRAIYDGLMLKLAAHSHGTGEELWGQVLNSASGRILFVLSLFRVNHPDMTADECETIAMGAADSLAAAMERQVPGFFEVCFPKHPPEVREAATRATVEAMERARLAYSGVGSANGTAL